MIIEYHRPKSLEAALDLISRVDPKTVPMGGGSVLSRSFPEDVAVVDLQDLGLDSQERKGKSLDIGATTTLQSLMNVPELMPALVTAIRYEANYNQRQNRTVAGTLVSATGRSPFTTVMIALDAQLTMLPGKEIVDLGSFMPIREKQLSGRLVSLITVPMNVKLTYHYVARTPADLPIVCVSLAYWPSGRTRVSLGGYGNTPLLAMDGPESDGAEVAARNAYQEAGDQWASAAYRSDVAGTLTKRCIAEIID
jgi:CO/xanthine dehydrogenase FAD-binding subunit